MFGRSESEQVRALLRLVEQQQRTIDNLADRLMFLVGRTWTPPPFEPEQSPMEEEPVFVSAFDRLPPTEEDYGAEPE